MIFPRPPAPSTAGNVIYDGFHHYSYDAEGRLYSVDGTRCYTYDGDGDQVATTNCNVVNAGNGTTSGIVAEFLYDPSHRLMSEINVGTEKLQRANIYAGGSFVAEDSPDAFLTNSSTATQLRITDQVGSLRGLQDLGNPYNVWPGAWTSFPYGDAAVPGDGGDSGDLSGGMLFTGKERDSESGLDYFGARFYASNLGRFMSPDYDDDDDDPHPVPYADLGNPQTLNLYGYVTNNPLRLYDPTGHDGYCDVLPSMAEVDAGIAYLEGGLETAATFSAGATVGAVGFIGSQIFAPAQMGNDPAERAYLNRARTESPTAAHTKDARPSTKGKHQKGQGRKKKDGGGEKGDATRRQNGMYGRKPPPGHKGPWPPRDDNNNFNMIPVVTNDKDNSTVTTTQEDHFPPPPPPQPQQPQQQ